jgi:hypothetical protein
MIVKKVRVTSPIKIYNKNNRKCPECKQPMVWYEGLIQGKVLDFAVGRYACDKCNLLGKTQDSREMMKGRRMAKQYKYPNFKWTDIAYMSIPKQLGILREIQNPKPKDNGK